LQRGSSVRVEIEERLDYYYDVFTTVLLNKRNAVASHYDNVSLSLSKSRKHSVESLRFMLDSVDSLDCATKVQRIRYLLEIMQFNSQSCAQIVKDLMRVFLGNDLSPRDVNSLKALTHIAFYKLTTNYLDIQLQPLSFHFLLSFALCSISLSPSPSAFLRMISCLALALSKGKSNVVPTVLVGFLHMWTSLLYKDSMHLMNIDEFIVSVVNSLGLVIPTTVPASSVSLHLLGLILCLQIISDTETTTKKKIFDAVTRMDGLLKGSNPHLDNNNLAPVAGVPA